MNYLSKIEKAIYCFKWKADSYDYRDEKERYSMNHCGIFSCKGKISS